MVLPRLVAPACLVVLFACKSEQEPAYLSIDAVSMQQSNQGEQSISATINDAWVYIDDNLEGAFELPCKIPVLKDGEHKITIGSGIWVNGLPTLRTPYVFYRFYETNLNLEKGSITAISPFTKYSDNIKFPYQAGFDTPSGNTLEAGTQSDTLAGITTKPSEVCEGSGSFQAKLFRDEGFVEFQQVEPVTLPKQGAYVFLEMNYTSSHPLKIGIRSFYPASGSVYSGVTTLGPAENWKKVYVNLTSAVSTEVNAQNYRVVFSSLKNAGSLPLEIKLDNLKLVHF